MVFLHRTVEGPHSAVRTIRLKIHSPTPSPYCSFETSADLMYELFPSSPFQFANLMWYFGYWLLQTLRLGEKWEEKKKSCILWKHKQKSFEAYWVFYDLILYEVEYAAATVWDECSLERLDADNCYRSSFFPRAPAVYLHEIIQVDCCLSVTRAQISNLWVQLINQQKESLIGSTVIWVQLSTEGFPSFVYFRDPIETCSCGIDIYMYI